MKIVLITSKKIELGGIFGMAYKSNNGVPFSDIIVLPKRKKLDFPLFSKLNISLKFFGMKGIFELIKIKFFPFLLNSEEKDCGYSLGWLKSIRFKNTRIHYVKSTKNNELLNLLKTISPELIISKNATIIFKKEILELPSVGAINIHNGLIPKYRGHFGTFWEVLSNENYGYISIHEMAPKVDTGRIIAFDRIEMKKIENFLDVMIEKRKKGGALLANLTNLIFQNKKLPDSPSEYPKNQDQGYYGFPTINDIRRFSWKKYKKN